MGQSFVNKTNVSDKVDDVTNQLLSITSLEYLFPIIEQSFIIITGKVFNLVTIPSTSDDAGRQPFPSTDISIRRKMEDGCDGDDRCNVC